ncbi:MAG: hypothetical protein SFW36_17570, partial [Leptolyngbyaceae cyanobacterium bins.59]|nr:hypothetical protein [Leptolyngbyaceae cyanobacterium bins.59]
YGRSSAFSANAANSTQKALEVREAKNPTALGDEALILIKVLLARRGQFSYTNLVNIFIKQNQGVDFQTFKKSLIQYLTFGVESKEFVEALKLNLSAKLPTFLEHHHAEEINNPLILRTCNRIIEYLTTEDQKEPSPLFIGLLSSGNPLPLVIIFLKLILLCRHTRAHLEARIARLIQYYEKMPEEDCQWIIHFLEVLNITFAIHAENVQYNLIKMNENGHETYAELITNVDNYRIFSLQKGARPPKDDPEAFSLSEEVDTQISGSQASS